MRISTKFQKIAERLPQWAAPLVLTGILIGVMACGGSDSSQVPGVRSVASEARQESYQAPSASYSNESTGVFVNRQELSMYELAALQTVLGAEIPSGYYWLDAQGNYGIGTGPAIGNLYYGGGTSGGGSSVNRVWSPGGDLYTGGSGADSYFFDSGSGSGCSVMGGQVSC